MIRKVNLNDSMKGTYLGCNFSNDEIVKYLKNINVPFKELNDEKVKSIKSRIRKNCSPKHVPSIIIKEPEIPRTKSGKIVEVAVRKILNGEKINNLEAIANPESLEFFKNLEIN